MLQSTFGQDTSVNSQKGLLLFCHSFPGTITVVKYDPDPGATSHSGLAPSSPSPVAQASLQALCDGRLRALEQTGSDPNSRGAKTPYKYLEAASKPRGRCCAADREPAPHPHAARVRYPEDAGAPGWGRGRGRLGSRSRDPGRASAAFPHTKWRPAHLGSPPPEEARGRPAARPRPPRAAHSPQSRRGGPKAERE